MNPVQRDSQPAVRGSFGRPAWFLCVLALLIQILFPVIAAIDGSISIATDQHLKLGVCDHDHATAGHDDSGGDQESHDPCSCPICHFSVFTRHGVMQAASVALPAMDGHAAPCAVLFESCLASQPRTAAGPRAPPALA